MMFNLKLNKNQMKVNDLYFKYKKDFEEKGIGELSLRILICKICNFDSMTELELKRDNEIELTKKDIKLIEKVLDGKPVQYAIKETEFYNMDFYVNKKVLIPRPETEELVNKLIKRINEKFLHYSEQINIYDLCCGSGNIAISLDKLVGKDHLVYGYDNSYGALKVAKKNQKKLGFAGFFIYKNVLKDFEYPTKINVLVSNPPYIENANEIDDNVLDYEPKKALLAKPGTIFYEKILSNCSKSLQKPFILAFEIGYDQKERLNEIISSNYFYRENTKWVFEKDMEGKDRFLFIESL